MKYHIQKQNRQPAYLQLYAQLRRDMEDGIYPYGAKMPSKRMLAEEVGISLVTVEHSYALLCEEGYLTAKERSGYFVSYRKGELLLQAESPDLSDPQPVTGHSGGDFPFSVLAKTMRRVLSEHGERLLQKSPNHGTTALREAVAAYLARNNGITVGAEQIIIGSGAEYLYSLILQLLGKQRVFGLEHPSYDKIRRVYEAGGAVCRLLKMGKDGIRSQELAVTDATVLHVTPFHSYPSGVTASASKRREYLDWAEHRNGYLIEDHYDSELTPSKKNEEPIFSLDRNQRVIYLNTFTQTIAPSIRVGYMVLPPHLLAEFSQRLGFYSCTVPVFEQLVLARLLTSGDFERHINRVRRARRKQKP